MNFTFSAKIKLSTTTENKDNFGKRTIKFSSWCDGTIPDISSTKIVGRRFVQIGLKLLKT